MSAVLSSWLRRLGCTLIDLRVSRLATMLRKALCTISDVSGPGVASAVDVGDVCCCSVACVDEGARWGDVAGERGARAEDSAEDNWDTVELDEGVRLCVCACVCEAVAVLVMLLRFAAR